MAPLLLLFCSAHRIQPSCVLIPWRGFNTVPGAFSLVLLRFTCGLATWVWKENEWRKEKYLLYIYREIFMNISHYIDIHGLSWQAPSGNNV